MQVSHPAMPSVVRLLVTLMDPLSPGAIGGGITQASKNVAGLAFREIHPSAGFGVRFRLLNDARVDVRVDRGYGDNSSGIYTGVNEAL